MSPADLARARASFYAFLDIHFLELPGGAFVSALRDGQFRGVLKELALGNEIRPEIAEGASLMQAYLDGTKTLDVAELAERLGVDRTRLYRGTSPQAGPPPPYEALWIREGEECPVLQELAGIYARGGFRLKADVHERLDYIGIQMNFMERLVTNEISAREAGDPVRVRTTLDEEKGFMQNHLGRWAPKFVLSALDHARTDFYRGHLHMLKGFFEQEQETLGGGRPFSA
jgi:putative dimethyl sulfoxide reductase chaperone